MEKHSPLDTNDELRGKYYMDIYRRRFVEYGPHPKCVGCLKCELCMVSNMPGYDFECNERLEGVKNEG